MPTGFHIIILDYLEHNTCRNFEHLIKCSCPVQGMKAYRERRDISPLILNITTRWKWVVNVIPQLLYHQERNLKYTAKEAG
jgi:hypothetical protein